MRSVKLLPTRFLISSTRGAVITHLACTPRWMTIPRKRGNPQPYLWVQLLGKLPGTCSIVSVAPMGVAVAVAEALT